MIDLATICPRCAGHERRVSLLAAECAKTERLLARIRDVLGAEADRLDYCIGRKQALASRAVLLDLLDEMKGS